MSIKISVKSLNFWFGQNQVLKNINLDISEKAITAIIGPSGCGKTTLLRCFNRMHDLYPDIKYSGKIYIGGKDILGKCELSKLRFEIGMVFQKPTPFPMSIYKNVAFGLKANGKTKDIKLKVEEALKKAALWDEVKDKLNESAITLSGGQQQRLCIARALAVEPEVLLLDEPTSALDPVSATKIEHLLFELKKDITVVIVTHNMQQAARVSDFTAFLWMGEVIEFGRTPELFTNPKNKLTEDYITGRLG